jgi:hypothetical protein
MGRILRHVKKAFTDGNVFDVFNIVYGVLPFPRGQSVIIKTNFGYG